MPKITRFAELSAQQLADLLQEKLTCYFTPGSETCALIEEAARRLRQSEIPDMGDVGRQ